MIKLFFELIGADLNLEIMHTMGHFNYSNYE